MSKQVLAEPLSAAAKQDPYPIYAALRAHQPVRRIALPDGRGLWLITRYDDVERALRDPRLVKDARNALTTEWLAWIPDGVKPFLEHMLVSDPPDHTRLRALVHKAFSPRLIEGLRPRIQQIADELLDAVEDDRAMDLIDSYAFPLPMTVITELLGVPSRDRDRFREWSNAAVKVEFEGNGELFPEPRQAAFASFAAYFRALFEDKRANPSDDLVTALVLAEEEGEALDEDELVAMLFLLLVAGHETTVNLIGNGMLALLRHPDQLRMLQADQALIVPAVEELLRYDGPVETSTFRYAAEDVEVNGATIPQGEIVLVVLASANRDADRFTDADRLDITRTDNRHLAFGKGIHFCLGAPLARMEAQIAIGTLLRRLPKLRLAVPPDQLEWRPGILIRGLRAFPVRF
ncbi:MAG: cytochrome P450 family protein [Egibacteraceae bacterium]